MYRLRNLIERIFTKKNIKIFLLLFIVLWLFVWTSFAANWATDMTPTQKMSYFMNILISILSWWWVILATLAWKFMTNDFVYGTFLHLDESLWNLWNMMKNFANFTLWFVLIFTIVKNLFKWSFWKDNPIQGAKDTIINSLVAWVLIQMSWFLIAVMLDLSTIATAAVWALPSQFMVGNSDFQGEMSDLITKVGSKVVIDLSSTWDIVDIIKTWNLNTNDDVNKLLDTILPSSDSMVWPFIFLWASVFNLYDLTDTSKNLGWESDWSDVLLSLWINWFVLVIFSLMLWLVFVFNLFRVITLRIVIPLSPFIFMLFAFSRWWKSPVKIEKFLWDVTNFGNIVNLIFKPVYMTLVLSIVLIVMVLVRTLVKANNWSLDLTEHNNMTIVSRNIWTGDQNFYDSSLNVSNIANINMKMKNSIVDILVYILCLILMVLLVKSCVSWKITWIKFIDDKINWLSKLMRWWDWEFWWLLWTAWVLPIWKDDKGNTVKVWIGTTINYVKDAKGRINRKLEEKEQEQDRAIRKAWWLDNTSGDFDSLKYIVNTPQEREEWIAQAIVIWKRKWYRIDSDFYNDKSFTSAMEYFNTKKKDSTIESITAGTIVNKMNEGKEKANEETEKQEDQTSE